MTPTEQQLKDPQWWDDNAPSDEHVLLVSTPDEALITWAKILGGGDFVDENGTIYQNSRLFNIYKRPTEPEAKFIPKAGEWCEVTASNFNLSKQPALVEYIGESIVVFKVEGNEYVTGRFATKFTPTRPKRDVFIERASGVPFCGKESIKNHYGDLFDAGFKAPETNDE